MHRRTGLRLSAKGKERVCDAVAWLVRGEEDYMRKKNERLARLRRASFTVEAALLMSGILMATLVMIYLSWHIYDRAYLTAYACELALSGHERELPSLPALEDLTKKTDASEAVRSVTCSAKGVYVSGQALLDIQVKETYEIVKPLKTIRRARALKAAVSGG